MTKEKATNSVDGDQNSTHAQTSTSQNKWYTINTFNQDKSTPIQQEVHPMGYRNQININTRE